LEANILKLKKLYSMQLHTAEYVNDLLCNNLPHGYSSKVVELAKNQSRTVSNQAVRLVKSLAYEDLQILNIIIQLAKRNKAYAEAEKVKLKELTTNK